jgi:hypothetical protein
MEYWSGEKSHQAAIHYSNTPLLHHSKIRYSKSSNDIKIVDPKKHFI